MPSTKTLMSAWTSVTFSPEMVWAVQAVRAFMPYAARPRSNSKFSFFINLIALLAWSPSSQGAISPSDTPALAAQYYMDHHEYAEALLLWSNVFKKQPDNLEAIYRLGELKFLLEGRLASRDFILDYLNQHENSMNSESRSMMRTRFERLQTIFLTDEGQTTFLQARTRMERKDYQGALPGFERAAALEKGNVKVLKEKANCEKALGLWEPFALTTKSAYENDPFDLEIVGNLADSYAYKAQYEKVVDLFQNDSELLAPLGNRTAYAVALAETGAVATAVPLLQALVEKGKAVSILPILWFELGQVLAKRRDSAAEATNYLEQFIRSVPAVKAAGEVRWDPYHLSERRSEAEKLLLALRGDSPRKP